MSYQTITLGCGLRVVCAPRQSPTVYCGLAVDAGTRHELAAESGMAHFTEHMSFKGTATRTARGITCGIEGVGGDLNAFTAKEETVYHCAVPAAHWRRAVGTLLDMALRSAYRQRDMDREAQVVIDEIESYNDSPGELVFDEFDSLMFPGHGLGRSILGDADRLRQYTTADMRAFARRLYHPARMVLFVLGDVPAEAVARTAERVVGAWPQTERQPCAPPAEPPRQGVTRVSKGTHQSHVVMGARCGGATDPRRHALHLLNNILGGPGSGSRLNQALRERRGLVYTVDSYVSAFTDAGLWTVYFGCDKADVRRCMSIVRRELDRLCQQPLPPRALAAAQRQLKGQLAIARDNPESVALALGKAVLHYGTALSPEQRDACIDAVTAAEVQAVAQSTFASLTTLIYE